MAGKKGIVVQVTANTKKLRKKLGSLNFNSLFKGLAAGGAVGGVGALTAGLAGSVSAAADLDTSMREVMTLIPDRAPGMLEEWKDRLGDLNTEYGTLSSDSVPALYAAISAGVAQDDVFDFMEVAARAATAGVADLADATDLLTSATNAFASAAPDDILSAQQASDLFFTTVRLGKTTIPELAASVAEITTPARAAGLALEEPLAAMAALTAQGIPTSQAATKMKSAIEELIKPGKKAHDAFEDLVGQSFPAFIAGGGDLIGAMRLLTVAADDAGVEVANLFARSEGGQFAQIIGGSDAAAEALAAMSDSAGATDAAFGVMAEGAGFQAGQLGAVWRTTLERVGAQILPLASAVLPHLASAFQALSTGAVSAVRAVAGWWRRVWPQVSAVLTDRIIPVLRTARDWIVDRFGPPIRAVAAAVADYLRGPFVGHVRAVARFVADAVGGLVSMAVSAWQGARPVLAAVRDGLVAAFDAARPTLERIGQMLAAVGRGLKRLWDTALKPVLERIGPPVLGVAAAIAGLAAGFAAAKAVILAVVAPIVAAIGGLVAVATGPFVVASLAIGAAIAAGIVIWRRWGDQITAVARTIWSAITTIVKPVLSGLIWYVREVVFPLWRRWFGLIRDFAAGAWTAIKAAWRDVLRPALAAVIEFVQGRLWPAMKTAFGRSRDVAVGAWTAISAVWQRVLRPALAAVSRFVRRRLWPAIKTVWAAIGTGFKIAAGVIAAAWTGVLKPALTAIGWFVANVMWPTLRTVWSAISTAFSAAAAAIRWAWENIGQPALTAVGWFAANVLWPTIRTVWSAISIAFSAAVDAIGAVWTGVLQPLLAAVGAGAKWVWQHLIQPAWAGIAAGFGLAVDAIGFVWTEILSPLFVAVGAGAKWVWQDVIQPAWDGIAAGFGAAVDAIGVVWTEILSPLLGWVGDHIEALWTNRVKPVWDWLGSVFSAAVGVISTAWTEILSPLLTAIGEAVWGWWTGTIQQAWDGLGAAFNVAAGVISTAWETILRPIIGIAAGALVGAVANLWRFVIQPAWDGLGLAFRGAALVVETAWNTVLRPILSAIRAAIDLVADAWAALPIDDIIDLGSKALSALGGAVDFGVGLVTGGRAPEPVETPREITTGQTRAGPERGRSGRGDVVVNVNAPVYGVSSAQFGDAVGSALQRNVRRNGRPY